MRVQVTSRLCNDRTDLSSILNNLHKSFAVPAMISSVVPVELVTLHFWYVNYRCGTVITQDKFNGSANYIVTETAYLKTRRFFLRKSSN